MTHHEAASDEHVAASDCVSSCLHSDKRARERKERGCFFTSLEC